MSDVTPEETTQFSQLRKEVKQDIDLAIANFKIWLLVTVLTNVILIGIPALYVFFTTTSTAQTALTLAMDARNRLDERSQWIARTDARMSTVERHLEEKDGFIPPRPEPLPK